LAPLGLRAHCLNLTGGCIPTTCACPRPASNCWRASNAFPAYTLGRDQRLYSDSGQRRKASALQLGNDFFMRNRGLFPSLGYRGQILDVFEEFAERANGNDDGSLFAIFVCDLLRFKVLKVEHGPSPFCHPAVRLIKLQSLRLHRG
jgi:hypothetical protein